MDVLIYDIETMQELFLVHVYDPKEDKHYDFLISQWQDNLRTKPKQLSFYLSSS